MNMREIDHAFLSAAYEGTLQQMQELLDQGADINAREIDDECEHAHDECECGQTPLMQAAYAKRLDAIQFLLAHKANAHAISYNQTTPLFALFEYHDEEDDDTNQFFEAIKALVHAGANLNAINKHGESVLSQAINHFENSPEIIEYLLRKGAKPNIGRRGYGSFHDVMNLSRISYIPLLLRYEADYAQLSQEDSIMKRKTPLTIAVDHHLHDKALQTVETFFKYFVQRLTSDHYKPARKWLLVHNRLKLRFPSDLRILISEYILASELYNRILMAGALSALESARYYGEGRLKLIEQAQKQPEKEVTENTVIQWQKDAAAYGEIAAVIEAHLDHNYLRRIIHSQLISSKKND